MTGKIFKMESLGQARQGDVLLKPIEKVPDECEPYTLDIVHRGEGEHTHRMTGEYQMFASKEVNPLTHEKDIYIIITPEESQKLKEESQKQQGTLAHEEHDHIILAPGTYLKRPQREYDAIATMQQLPITLNSSRLIGMSDPFWRQKDRGIYRNVRD